MKEATRKQSESGQAIVLLVLVLTALMAAVGLAVDGGRLYLDRRTAQNAADNASIAAAHTMCSGGDYVTAAFASAYTNGFDNNGTTNSMTVISPPISGPNVGDNEYVEVTINSLQEASFSQLIFSGSLENTVRAVSRCGVQGGIPFPGEAIIALDPEDGCSFDANGNGSITANGGGIFVNSDDEEALCAVGNASILSDDTIEVVGGWDTNGGATIDPEPATGVPPTTDPMASMQPPPHPGGSCNDYSLNANNSDTIDPGFYCKIKISGNAELTMNAGVYYIDSGDFDISGGGLLDAVGVMIYLASGDFSITGNGDFNISAPTSGPYAGLMLFMDQENGGDIKIAGNGAVSTTGTIYGPISNLDISGNGSGTVINSQIIVGKIDSNGNGNVNVFYDQGAAFQGVYTVFMELSE